MPRPYTGGDAILPTLRLPRPDGTLEPYVMREPVVWTAPTGPIQSRVAYAAAHVVCDPLADCDPLSQPARLGGHAFLPSLLVVLRTGRRRGDGHSTARHGAGLAGGARAHPPLVGRGTGDRRNDRVRCRHRPFAAG